MNLMWPGPDSQEAYHAYLEGRERYKGERLRLDGPKPEPTVATTMMVALHHDEDKALEIARRGMTGLQRRTFATHRFVALIIDEDEQDAALAPLKAIQADLEGARPFGAGTPSQLAERM